MSPLSTASVRRVQEALAGAGSAARVVALTDTARSAEDAARAVGCPLGAIVKSLVFMVADQPVMVLVAGDRRCDLAALPTAAGLEGKVRRADADQVRAATGYAIGGVAPVGHTLPVVIDASLERFKEVWAAAGHPYCVFPTTVAELVRLTRGRVDDAIAV